MFTFHNACFFHRMSSTGISKEEQNKGKTRFSSSDFLVLMESFQTDPDLKSTVRASLAKKLGVDEKYISAWFDYQKQYSCIRKRPPAKYTKC